MTKSRDCVPETRETRNTRETRFEGENVSGAARAEDAQGTPTQSHIPPSILVYEDNYDKIPGFSTRNTRERGLRAFCRETGGARPSYRLRAPSPPHPLPSEYGTCKTVTARFWPWLQVKSPQHISIVAFSLGSGVTNRCCFAFSGRTWPS